MSKALLLSGAALLAGLMAAPAIAQTAPPAPAPAATEEADAPADVIVTAQKRSERLQDVPAAVSVVSGDALARSGAINLEGAQYLVPSFNFRKSGTALNQSLYLRGVGTSTFSIAGEPSISTVVDGVVYSRAGEAFTDLIDIERLEVLRGPQGTLFGKNASAGVINIVTKRPGDKFGGYIEDSYYTAGGEYRSRIAIDAPFSDKVRSRLTAFYGSYDGNITNVARNARVNGYEHWGLRGVIVAEPTNALTLTFIGDFRLSTDDCCAEVIGTTPTNLAAAAVPTPRGDLTRQVNQNLITSTLEQSWGFSLQADLKLDDYTITWISAYRNYRNLEIRDGDFLDRAYVGINELHDFGPQTGDTVTQELRLTSPGGRPLQYVLGAFYSTTFSQRTFSRFDIVCTLTPTPTVLTPCTAPGAVVTRPTGTATFGSTFDNIAVFGQGTLKITNALNLVGGFRFTHDRLDVFHSRVTTLAGPGIQPSFGPFQASTASDNISGKIGVQYDIVPESTVYFTYSRGYKGPAYNVFFNLTATGTNVIAPETSNSYEIGLKNTLLDGRLTANIAAYYATYDNFQANNPDVVAGVLVTRFTNAGAISTRGVEVDLLYRPFRDFSINAGLAYTDARVDQFRIPDNGVVTGVIPNGTPLAYAPLWKGTLGANYRWRTNAPVDFELGGQASTQSSQLSQFDPSATIRAATTIRSYTLFDITAAVLDKNDRFKLSFQVKNLLGESFAAAITSGGPGGSFRYIIPREADRYFGIIGRVNF